MLSRLLYTLRFRWHIWRNVPDMPLRMASRYPTEPGDGSGDPISDADDEISYMAEG